MVGVVSEASAPASNWLRYHAATGGFHECGVVGGVARRGMCSAQHIGTERLRGLYGHQRCTIGGVHHMTHAVDLLAHQRRGQREVHVDQRDVLDGQAGGLEHGGEQRFLETGDRVTDLAALEVGDGLHRPVLQRDQSVERLGDQHADAHQRQALGDQHLQRRLVRHGVLGLAGGDQLGRRVGIGRRDQLGDLHHVGGGAADGEGSLREDEHLGARRVAGDGERCGGLDGLEVQGGGQLERVTLKTKTGLEEINANRLLAFFGLNIELGPIAEWGLDLADGKLISVDTEKFSTSTPGIFAIGDINHYPGKLKLILSGFHEAALASHAAFKIARPEQKLRFQIGRAHV